MSWYFVDNEEKVGPLEDVEFHELVSRGRISDDTLVWQKGMREWEPYENVSVIKISVQIPEAAPETSADSEQFPPESLLAPLPDDMSDLGNSRAMPSAPIGLHYAGFGVRLVAKIIDGFVLSAVFGILSVGMAMFVASAGAAGTEAAQGTAVVVVLVFYFIALLSPIAYNAFFVARPGATPGKKAMGLRVVNPNGRNVSTGQAWGRAFADLLSQMTMYIGYLLVIFDDEKRALHDHVCGTRVIGKQ